MIVKNKEKKEKNTVFITVEIDREKFEEAINSAYKKNRGRINVPGFRRGKAPLKIIENMYGASVFYDDAVDILAPEAYTYAVEQEKLETVGRPSIADINISDEKVLTLTFATAVYPEVTLKQYKGLEAVKKDATVTDEDVANELEVLRNKNSRLVTVTDRDATIGDTVVIDFEGFIDGKPFDGGKAENYSLMLGSATFVPGFEEQLSGMKVGEEKEVNVTFPKEYVPELAGKNAVFKVKLHEIKETVFPELDDEFAKDVSEYDTLEDFKKSIYDKLLTEKEGEAKTAYRQGIIEQLAQNLEADIPDAMIDEQLDKMVEDYSMRMQSQGIALDDYLKMVGVSREDFLKSGRLNAENQVKVTLALKKVAELENMEATDEEVEAEYKKLSENYKVDIEKVKAVIPLSQMKNDIVLMKAEEFVAENGKAVEAKADAEPTAEKETVPKKAASKKSAVKNADDATDAKPAKKTSKKAEKKDGE